MLQTLGSLFGSCQLCVDVVKDRFVPDLTPWPLTFMLRATFCLHTVEQLPKAAKSKVVRRVLSVSLYRPFLGLLSGVRPNIRSRRSHGICVVRYPHLFMTINRPLQGAVSAVMISKIQATGPEGGCENPGHNNLIFSLKTNSKTRYCFGFR